MNTINECPCCSEQLLRHARHGQVYWFCLHCRQEMPNLSAVLTTGHQKTMSSKEKLNNLLNLV